MKICIAHFRLGLTDGVSLQIDERARVLRQLGHEVSLIASSNSPMGDLKIPSLNYKEDPQISEIQLEAFSGEDLDDKKAEKITERVEQIAGEIEQELNVFWERKEFALIFIHNVFCLPVCLPAAIAFYNFLRNHPQVDAIAVHHDFYWDPPRVDLFKPKHDYFRKILDTYYPPILPIKHTVLSVWEQEKLREQKGIVSKVINDTYDFDRKPWQEDSTNKNYLKDAGIDKDSLKLLIASRVRPRKGIEIGIEFVSVLQKLIAQKEAGVGFGKVVLILPNDYTDKEDSYVSKLKSKSAKLGVEVKWLQNLVGSEEEKNKGIKKYSLWDTYVYADAVLYPSLWEGFGNQFLEALFAKKPLVSLEYPIFKTDIEPAGFRISSITDEVGIGDDGLVTVDSKLLQEPAKDLLRLLGNRNELKKTVDKNFRIAKRKYNTKLQLREYLTESSEKYIIKNGIKSVISPLLLSGRLVASGCQLQSSYSLAEMIVSKVPDSGIKGNKFFELITENLHGEIRERYVTLELMKEFLVSPKSKSPLFIFIGGLAGKTTLSNLVVQHLGVSQPIVMDNEKLRIAKPGVSKPFLWKATYETKKGYIKTTELMLPLFMEMLERNLFDYGRYKKWCYFWEGIYLSSGVLKKIYQKHGDLYYLSVFNLPKNAVVRKQYLLRWLDELGPVKLKKRKNVIDRYLKNLSVIRSHITNGFDPIASFVIESSVLEERLNIFYTILYQRLKDIARIEIPGWIDKVVHNPKMYKDYRNFLRGN